jgi:hypothetical protein
MESLDKGEHAGGYGIGLDYAPTPDPGRGDRAPRCAPAFAALGLAAEPPPGRRVPAA